MKMKAWTVILAATAGFVSQSARADVLYANNTGFNADYASGTLEVGNEIFISGPTGFSYITDFSFQYYANFSGANHELITLRFYDKNGPAQNGNTYSPGTLLFGETFDIGAFGPTSGANLPYSDTTGDFPSGGVIVPNDFIYTVTFSNLVPGDDEGLALYSPVTVGNTFTAAWQDNPAFSPTGWTLVTNATYDMTFGAEADGSPAPAPEPSSILILALGGMVGLGCVIVRNRRSVGTSRCQG